MLAGNVTAQLLGQNAFINGDAADNSVEILIEGGNVVVRGTDGTTINGNSGDFVLAANATGISGSLFARFAGGNNSLAMNGVRVARDVSINGARGNDQFVLLGGTTVGRNVGINGWRGNDTISVQDSTIGRHAWIWGWSGNDVLVVSTATIGRDLNISAGSGNDDVVIDDSRIGRDTRIAGWGGDDDIVIRNSELVDDLSISGHGGNDIIMFDSSTVGDKSWMNGGGGADNIMIQGTSRFFDKLRTAGGPGRDNIESTSGVVFDGFKHRSFKGFTADAAAVASRITDPVTGALAAAEAAVGLFDPRLSLSVDNASVSEAAGNGAATLTITRSADTDSDLEVSLSTAPSGQTALSLGQTTVTIPAGQSSVTVPVNALDNQALNDDTVVTVTAAGAGFTTATVTISVTNDDFAALTLTTPSSQVFEDTGSPTTTGTATVFDVTVNRTGDMSNPLAVSLSTPDTDRLTVPATVTIPAGQTSSTFAVQTIPDLQVNANNTVVAINAASVGFTSGQVQVTLVDTDAPTLLVGFDAPTISEDGNSPDGQAVFTVTRNTDTTNELVVNVVADPATEVQLSSGTITIPAGSASGSVTVRGVEDQVVAPPFAVAVTASANGFASGSDTITVTDNDSPALSLAVTTGSTVAENAGTGAVTARVSRNIQNPATDLVVAVNVTGDDRLAAQSSTVTIPAGQTFTDVVFDTLDNNLAESEASGTATVTVSATDFASATADVTITNDDVATITLSPANFSVNEDAGIGGASVTLSRNTADITETVSLTYSDAAASVRLLSGETTVVFAQGELEKVVQIDVLDNTSFLENNSVTVTASAPDHADVMAVIGVINDDVLELTTDVTDNVTSQSVTALVTKDNTFTVKGETAPGATVQIENDGDDDFQEFSTVADTGGNYSIDVPLTHDSTNNGLNTIQVRSVVPTEGVDRISDPINVHLAIGTVVRFEINMDLNNDGSADFYDVELLDTDAPDTVDNFRQYVNDGAYNNMFVHRSPPNFVIQGGGFTLNNGTVSSVVTRAPIPNEFQPANSNVRGTLSMALPGDELGNTFPDQGTSQWFVNVVDNSGDEISGLDKNLHTVFGEVIAGGMTVVDAINGLPVSDVIQIFANGALLQTPFPTSLYTQLTGTVAFTGGTSTLTGTGTLFTSELQVGSAIRFAGASFLVTSIVSDTELTYNDVPDNSGSGRTFELIRPPADAEFVVFSNIAEILDTI